jgi:hypothetical protein
VTNRGYDKQRVMKQTEVKQQTKGRYQTGGTTNRGYDKQRVMKQTEVK